MKENHEPKSLCPTFHCKKLRNQSDYSLLISLKDIHPSLYLSISVSIFFLCPAQSGLFVYFTHENKGMRSSSFEITRPPTACQQCDDWRAANNKWLFWVFGSPGEAVKYQSGRVSRPLRSSVSKQRQLLGNTQNDVWLINNSAVGFSVSQWQCQVGRRYRACAATASAAASAFTLSTLIWHRGIYYQLSLEAKQSKGTKGLPVYVRRSQRQPTNFQKKNDSSVHPLELAAVPLAGSWNEMLQLYK